MSINHSSSSELERIQLRTTLKDMLRYRDIITDPKKMASLSIKEFSIMDSQIYLECIEYGVPTFDLKEVYKETGEDILNTLIKAILTRMVSDLVSLPSSITHTLFSCSDTYTRMRKKYLDKSLNNTLKNVVTDFEFSTQKLDEEQTNSAKAYIPLLTKYVQSVDKLIDDSINLLKGDKVKLGNLLTAVRNESLTNEDLANLSSNLKEFRALIHTPYTTVSIDEGEVNLTVVGGKKLTFVNDLTTDNINAVSILQTSREKLTTLYRIGLVYTTLLHKVGEALISDVNKRSTRITDMILSLNHVLDYSAKMHDLLNGVAELSYETNLTSMEFIKATTKV